MFRDMEKKLWQLSQYRGEGRYRFRADLSQNGESNIASNALNHWLHRIHKTDIIVLSVVLMQ